MFMLSMRKTTYGDTFHQPRSRIVTRDNYDVFVLTTAGEYTTSIAYDIKSPAYVHVQG